MDVWIGIGIAVGVLVVLLYNNILAKRNGVEKSISTIETYFQKRFDLMTNLFLQAEKALDHEKEIFIEVAKIRTHYDELKQSYEKNNSTESVIRTDKELSSLMKSFNITVEQYPMLRGVEAIQTAMNANIEVENEIGASRRQYNDNVEIYRNAIQSFPNILLAGLFGFGNKYDLYKADEQAKTRVEPLYAGEIRGKYEK
ncbi:MAG: hypothetical protein A2Y24_04115 [Clostridiales bacterium GWE2_32_10]|nr:MAG: hypothetical protein A2Y24_04115 [Clostridiales bacterium GWE2_32_10]